MLTYRYVWLTLAGGLTAIGLVAGLVAWAPVAVLTFLLLATVVAAGTASITSQEGRGLPWRRVTRTGILTAAVVVGAGGLIDLLGTWGFALVVTTAVVCPRAVAWAARLSAVLGDEGAGPATPQPRVDAWLAEAHAGQPYEPGAPAGGFPASPGAPWMVRPVGGMDDEALCLAWRSSYVALQRVGSGPGKLTIVQRRQELLDELEHRSVRGFSAWLASNPRAAGDPSRYLVDDPGAQHRPPTEP